MRQRYSILALAVTVAGAVFAMTTASSAKPDASGGERVFQACGACHSLEPDQNMTGPSLAGLWNRKAGSLASFSRYSDALKSSNIVWNDKTLDEWIEDPQHLVPGNQMPFAGIKNAQQRADLLSFLKQATQTGHAAAAPAQGAQVGGMMGGGGGSSGGVPNLKKLNPNEHVQKVTHCRDTYRVTTADGKTRAFWERNLRLKTDSGIDGPNKGVPALMGAGMMGDRADVIFSTPDEISGFIKDQCGER